MPLLVKYFLNRNYSRETKTLIALLFSLLVGIVSLYLQGELFLNTQNFEKTLFEIFTISQISYNLFWKDYFEKSKMKGGEI